MTLHKSLSFSQLSILICRKRTKGVLGSWGSKNVVDLTQCEGKAVWYLAFSCSYCLRVAESVASCLRTCLQRSLPLSAHLGTILLSGKMLAGLCATSSLNYQRRKEQKKQNSKSIGDPLNLVNIKWRAGWEKTWKPLHLCFLGPTLFFFFFGDTTAKPVLLYNTQITIHTRFP